MKYQAPVIADIPEHLAGLSTEQYLSVFGLLESWKVAMRLSNVPPTIERVEPGVIPCWGRWSHNSWVYQQALQYRAEVFKRPIQMHISMLLHLALPPLWHLDIESDQEKETMRQYGFWRSVTEWVPPEVIIGRTVWVVRPSRIYWVVR